MQRLAVPALALLLLTGCASSKTGNQSTGVAVRQARIFVEGEDQGFTPATVQLRRDLGDMMVTLQVNQENVRTFILERATSSSSSTLAFGFWGGYSEGDLTYDVQNLPTRKDGAYLIPYAERRLRIEDRIYGLTLIVEN